jgi:hypothetical protein
VFTIRQAKRVSAGKMGSSFRVVSFHSIEKRGLTPQAAEAHEFLSVVFEVARL